MAIVLSPHATMVREGWWVGRSVGIFGGSGLFKDRKRGLLDP
jgi:hypothetical protein